MQNKTFTEELSRRFSKEIKGIAELSEKRISVLIHPNALIQISDFLFNEKKFRFIIASGLHTKEGFEILYHFSNDKTGHIINLNALMSHENPEIESLTVLFPAAEWIEREIYELLGIHFKGHPNLVKLISKENWPEGTYPYRKDFKP